MKVMATLIKKEIAASVIDLRFAIIALSCAVLIPLSIYVGVKDYQRRFADYQREYRLYRENYTQRSSPNMRAEGHRPPTPLSILAIGIDPFLPEKVITSRDGVYQTITNSATDTPLSLLFGRTDPLFIVTHVISLAALLMTFSSVSGEKAGGTLQLMVCYPIPRGRILLAKVVGYAVTLLVPFVLSMLISAIVLSCTHEVTLSGLMAFLVAFMCLLAVVFIVAMVILGIGVSTWTSAPATSLVVTLSIWILLVLVIPKVSPMLAEILYPMESEDVVYLHKQLKSRSIAAEHAAQAKELLRACRAAVGVSDDQKFDTRNSLEQQAMAAYDAQVVALDREYERRTGDAIRAIEQDHRNKKQVQTSIAMNISRLSPVSCFTYLASSLAGTGIGEVYKFSENAATFQDTMKAEVYDKWIINRYLTESGTHYTTKTVDGFDRNSLQIPPMRYEHCTPGGVLACHWSDLLLLCMSVLVFFGAAFIGFQKYDVRYG